MFIERGASEVVSNQKRRKEEQILIKAVSLGRMIQIKAVNIEK
jgi:hypothetical protein